MRFLVVVAALGCCTSFLVIPESPFGDFHTGNRAGNRNLCAGDFVFFMFSLAVIFEPGFGIFLACLGTFHIDLFTPLGCVGEDHDAALDVDEAAGDRRRRDLGGAFCGL